MEFVNFIITLGQFIIGCAVLGVVVLAFIAAGVEIYDRMTEKNETDEKTKARLQSIKDGES